MDKNASELIKVSTNLIKVLVSCYDHLAAHDFLFPLLSVLESSIQDTTSVVISRQNYSVDAEPCPVIHRINQADNFSIDADTDSVNFETSFFVVLEAISRILTA